MSLPDVPTCLTCGHYAHEHEPLDFGSYTTHDGALVRDMRLGGCGHIDGDTMQECWCQEWDPDTLPHVTALLGLDVRRVLID